MAWTVPRRTAMSMSWLATTPGNRLVMPRSSTARGCCSAGPSPIRHLPNVLRPGRYRVRAESTLVSAQLVGDRDGPADDLLFGRVRGLLVRLDGGVRLGVAD